ncbi:MAG: hypothetical protein H7838_04155 [Magnetococcus sp. DMHC-8]
MAHFAEINENGVVLRVLACQDTETPHNLSSALGGRWIQTSYHTRGGVHFGSDGVPDGGAALRKNGASPGYVYDEQRDAFIPPPPFPSWTLQEESCLWAPPVPRPVEGGAWRWDEASLTWVA